MTAIDLREKVFVAGHRGLVGGAVVRSLERQGATQILTRGRQDLDLLSQSAVEDFFKAERPRYVILAAAKVGGIWANDRFRGDFSLQNLKIQTNVIDAAFRNNVEKLVFLGSSCIYPKFAPQPIREDALLSGTLESTNDAYSIAKIAGLWLCRSLKIQYGLRYISVMPTNVYGPGDRYDKENSHVLPALIMKFHEAKVKKYPSVELWGSGTPKREFIHCDDLADAIVHCLKHYEETEHINLGTGQELSILELAQMVKEITGYEGKITWDPSKPDGTPRKILDSSKITRLGWRPQIPLRKGIAATYAAYTNTKGAKSV